MPRVFVYGTLRRHEPNAFRLNEAVWLARQAWVSGRLYDTGCGYPALVLDVRSVRSSASSHTGRVYGELVEVSEKALAALDALEGYAEGRRDNHYDRVSVCVHTDTGETEAFAYVYPEERATGLKPIAFGDWKVYRHLPDPTKEASAGSATDRQADGSDTWLYFAYGSCMDDRRFETDGVRELFRDVVGRGVLRGHTLAFTRRSQADGMGRADIVETGAPHDVVEGKVYRIGRQALRYLYDREGVRGGAYRPTFVDLEIGGETVTDVITFTVVEKGPETPPPPHYAEEILRGARGFVSEKYYEFLLNKCRI
ncbi:MAG: hypothetical protein HSCHL_1753 [Hydrogenibacillus schlegelii]|uniref:Gamma-glutamylcyclotransferase AIG2-like domain-containing protein n=1 Tax=Hydrogenibacillus schlegelii TaxID=1484 RepID=A0A2T5G4B5_HYDSH|nr:gamma-glutamylcyclotransferase family protein [Hydrogenibacillus schlegelii]PTQ51012.1 MAG: hypothetical protein HSCHL_1753 [Hydrogenibacillus schlegelii]